MYPPVCGNRFKELTYLRFAQYWLKEIEGMRHIGRDEQEILESLAKDLYNFTNREMKVQAKKLLFGEDE